MAKKNYVKMNNCHNATVESSGADRSTITFTGRNQNGTDYKIKVEVEDYFFPYMIRGMNKVVRERVKRANSRLFEFVESVKEGA